VSMHSRGSVVTRRSCWSHDLSRRDRSSWFGCSIVMCDRAIDRTSDRWLFLRAAGGQHVREPRGLIYGYLGA
jgi:hypothetical protein